MKTLRTIRKNRNGPAHALARAPARALAIFVAIWLVWRHEAYFRRYWSKFTKQVSKSGYDVLR